MPREFGHPDRDRGPSNAARVADEADADHLLGNAHIFSSVLREIFDGRRHNARVEAVLNEKQLRLLRLLARKGPLCVREIARVLEVSSPAATRNTDKLEQLGLIERGPDVADRRTRSLCLSSRGSAYIRAVDLATTAQFSQVAAEFQPGEVRQFTDLLARFSMLLLEGVGPNDSACLRCAAYLPKDCPIAWMHNGCLFDRVNRNTGGHDKPGKVPARN